jgi:predicted methyltransferase
MGHFTGIFAKGAQATTVVLYLQPAEVADSISSSPTQKKRLLAGKS